MVTRYRRAVEEVWEHAREPGVDVEKFTALCREMWAAEDELIDGLLNGVTEESTE